MAKCVFCGEKAAFGKTLMKSVFEFKTCASCHDIYEKEDEVRAILDAYNAGIYEQPEGLGRWLDEKLEDLSKKEQEYKEWRNDRISGACPMCGGKMISNDIVNFIADRVALPSLDRTVFNTTVVGFEPHCCEDCGYTEFYSVDSINRKESRKKRLERIDLLLRSLKNE